MTKAFGTPGPRAMYPSVTTSQSLAACDPLAQLLFDRLMSQADDQGRLLGDPKVVKALCMPLIPMATPRKVQTWLAQLAHERMVILYENAGRAFLQLTTWWGWQGSMKRSYPSRWPSPEGWTDRVRGVPPGETFPPTTVPVGEQVPPHARATEPNRTESDLNIASPYGDAKAVLKTLRSQVFTLWAEHQGWTSWNEHREDAIRITNWLRDKPYPLAFWQEIIPTVPDETQRFAHLTTPRREGEVCWLEQHFIDWQETRYEAEKAERLSTPPVVTFTPRAMP